MKRRGASVAQVSATLFSQGSIKRGRKQLKITRQSFPRECHYPLPGVRHSLAFAHVSLDRTKEGLPREFAFASRTISGNNAKEKLCARPCSGASSRRFLRNATSCAPSDGSRRITRDSSAYFEVFSAPVERLFHHSREQSDDHDEVGHFFRKRDAVASENRVFSRSVSPTGRRPSVCYGPLRIH